MFLQGEWVRLTQRSLFCPLVDEDDEYECVSVVNSHTQDVKHVTWHPTMEVTLAETIEKRSLMGF